MVAVAAGINVKEGKLTLVGPDIAINPLHSMALTLWVPVGRSRGLR